MKYKEFLHLSSWLKGEKNIVHIVDHLSFRLMIWNIFIIIQWLFLNIQMLIMVPCDVIRNESAKEKWSLFSWGKLSYFCYFPRLPGEVYQHVNKWWEWESGWSPWIYQPCLLSSTFIIYTIGLKYDKCSNFTMILFLEIQQSL